jgi:hypothetical protein
MPTRTGPNPRNVSVEDVETAGRVAGVVDAGLPPMHAQPSDAGVRR